MNNIDCMLGNRSTIVYEYRSSNSIHNFETYKWNKCLLLMDWMKGGRVNPNPPLKIWNPTWNDPPLKSNLPPDPIVSSPRLMRRKSSNKMWNMMTKKVIHNSLDVIDSAAEDSTALLDNKSGTLCSFLWGTSTFVFSFIGSAVFLGGMIICMTPAVVLWAIFVWRCRSCKEEKWIKRKLEFVAY